MTSKLLINEPPLQVSPTLAAIIGLNEAIFIQQLNYWLMNTKIQGAIIDGEKWIFNSVREWRENNFPFWSEKTISRMIQRLEESGIIISRQIEHSMDRRKLYRINYDVLNELTEAGISEMHEDSETEYTGSGCPFGHWQDDMQLLTAKEEHAKLRQKLSGEVLVHQAEIGKRGRRDPDLHDEEVAEVFRF